MTEDEPDEPPLERFEIEQYELHVATYEVEARSATEALKLLFQGDGNMLSGSEYIGTCDEKGMSVADDPELLEELLRLGVRLRGTMVPSIRSVRRLDDSEEQPSAPQNPIAGAQTDDGISPISL